MTEPQNKSESSQPEPTGTPLRGTILSLIVVWTFCYNLLIKQQNPVAAFFGILDTISDDFVMGILLTVTVGALIVAVFGVTKLYTQMIANVFSFRILEDIVYSEFVTGKFRSGMSRIINLENQELPPRPVPRRISSLVFCFGLIYAMSWVYVVLFAEALFFVSWSAGVDLPVNEKNVLLLPTLALSIPFSARVMAYLRYPYAQDYADFMPGALFVLLLVATLGYLFGTKPAYFLERVIEKPEYVHQLLTNGVFLAFIPVFFEGVFWLFELSRTAAPPADSGSDLE